jgi:heterodisulfide reductase subunit A
VPAVAAIDAAHCIYIQKGKCRICEKFCEAGAIDYTQKEKLIELEVGAIVVASGSQEFDARRKGEYGYGVFPNVVTSIEFERMLSASGPTAGHVIRPSDRIEPLRIGFIQCVGSRDVKQDNEFCSAVCCMQAAKHAIIVREHLPEAVSTIFYMDVRAYGKGFDRFVERARDEHKTRLVCGRIASIEEDPQTDNVFVHYITQSGNVKREEFDLIILSVGLEPSDSSTTILRRLRTATDFRGFLDVQSFGPVDSSCSGIFACGSISGPKDIPESVMEASGAASAAAASLGNLPGKEIHIDYPDEDDLRGQPPRLGVFVCRCGINIASTVDVPQVVEYAMGLPRVSHAQELLFSCSQDSQKAI